MEGREGKEGRAKMYQESKVRLRRADKDDEGKKLMKNDAVKG